MSRPIYSEDMINTLLEGNGRNMPKELVNIEVYYKSSIVFDLSELGIDPQEVYDWWVKYKTLHVIYIDGTEAEYEATSWYDSDDKFPDKSVLLDKDNVELAVIKGD